MGTSSRVPRASHNLLDALFLALFGKGAFATPSLDSAANLYQTAPALTSRAKGYIDAVYNFNGCKHSTLTIKGSDIVSRGLDLIVPGIGTPAQQQALQGLLQYGASQGVNVNVIIR